WEGYFVNYRRITQLGTALAVAGALCTPGAQAANDAMVELLKVLKDQGTITPEAYEQLKAAATADDEQNTAGQAEIKQAAQALPKVETKEKLEISTPDGAFKWRIGGRLHTDAAFYDNDTGSGDTTTLSSGADFRRARLAIEATLYRHWQLKLEYDFAGATDTDDGIRDAYLRYLHTAGWPLSVTVGQYKEYLGLESITSSNEISFIERALPSRTFNDIAGGADGRRLGVGVNTFGNDLWTASAGIFGRNAAGETGTDDQSDPITFVGRLTLSPVHTDNRAVHLGFAGSWLNPDDNDAVRFRSRPEARIGADRLVDTGDLATGEVNRFGAEAAGVYGPFSLQGEYLWATTSETDASPDLAFNGWYVMGSWIVTGESRRYEFEEARFKNPKPKGIVGTGGIGAWEVLARYSTLDLNDETVDGGEEDNFTFGVNWYPTPNFRFMANYVKVLDLKGGDFDGAEPHAFLLRAQAYW
ncbi:MAG: OprO/OprP family phosphate-selective porin, partial [Gammaproteobacteria bacterium]